MKYYYDTEFLEGAQGISTKPTIDLISIGVVAEDGREYYAISNQFNINEAWHRNDASLAEPNYWIRENVLKPIYTDLCHLQKSSRYKQYDFAMDEFSLDNLNWLIQQHGKSLFIIGEELKEFIKPSEHTTTELYGYYSDYDHVVLSWIFGRMIDLPKGMPMYTIDLKQELDRIANVYLSMNLDHPIVSSDWYPNYALDFLRFNTANNFEYPTNLEVHNALSDARWNRDLFLWINKVKELVYIK